MTPHAPEEARGLTQRGWSVVCALLMTAGALGIVFSQGAEGYGLQLVAEAGPDQTVLEGDIVVFDGSASEGSPTPRLDPRLISYWRMDEGSGSVAVDSTLKGHDLSLNSRAASDAGMISWGRRYNMGFDLAYSAGSTPFADFPTTDSFTVEAWVKPTAPGWQHVMLLTKWGERPSGGDDCGYNGNGWLLGIFASPYGSSNIVPQFAVKNKDKAFASAPSPSTIGVGAWSHLVGVRDVTSGTIGLYVNGISVASASDPGGSLETIRPLSLFGMTCGAAGWGSWGGTVMDETAIYGYARSASDIYEDYQDGLAGRALELYGPWQYERTVTVQNPNPFDLVGYPVSVTLDTQSLIAAGKVNPDGSDLRLTHDGAEVDFAVVDLDTATTSIVFKSSVAANGNDPGYTLYYGNPSASSVSVSYEEAFYEVIDEFNDGTIDPMWSFNHWSSYWQDAVNYYESSGSLHVEKRASGCGGEATFTTRPVQNSEILRIQFRSYSGEVGWAGYNGVHIWLITPDGSPLMMGANTYSKGYNDAAPSVWLFKVGSGYSTEVSASRMRGQHH